MAVLLRWIHFLAGITWIGLLYYLNFAQVPFFAETEPGCARELSRSCYARDVVVPWAP